MEPKINQQLTDRYAPYQEVCFVIDQQLLPPPFAKTSYRYTGLSTRHGNSIYSED